MSAQSAAASPRIESLEELIDYFREGEKPVERFRIGTEHEKIGVYEDTLERVRYEGERGIGALLEAIVARDPSWKRVNEGENLIGLLKDGASITLEPGGQLELSGAPLRTLRETCREFNAHVDLLNEVSAEKAIVWLALGADPFHRVDEIPVMPKGRYDIMRAYLPTKGSLALSMMHATATVQANFDYENEADMAAKMRMALGCSPIISALFANSPLSEGAENGFASRRVEIWRDTDPDRCGLLPFVFEDSFGYRDYAEWALDVPMFFVDRGGAYHAQNGRTFREFCDDGVEIDGATEYATLADWDLHLTTVFPEVRLKRFIEVRSADAAPGPFVCALPAVWKGLLYDAQAGSDAWSLVSGWSLAEREQALMDVARGGLLCEMGGSPALELARELVKFSAQGLARIAERGETDADERHFLEPLLQTLESGHSPAHAVLEAWRESGGSGRRLLERVRY
ncbi:MAG: glutamate--cysteine ligase [Myxococcota bacterium]|nr:glutamate--cysteine ligase [Myxococcota bacterium]